MLLSTALWLEWMERTEEDRWGEEGSRIPCCRLLNDGSALVCDWDFDGVKGV
jgi:hypothetical protein